jgi:hypothetical protein
LPYAPGVIQGRAKPLLWMDAGNSSCIMAWFIRCCEWYWQSRPMGLGHVREIGNVLSVTRIGESPT